MMNNDQAFSVSAVNKYIKQIFDNNFSLQNITIKGEISNFKKYSSGHVYFSLKDSESSIKAVMFYDHAKNLDKNIADGSLVIACGRITTYVQRGEYQLYVDNMELFGKGEQLLKLEMLKQKLAKEGLFDESRKRKINIFPKAIGVISAKNSAAFADIKTNILRRYPLVDVILFPSLVQGSEAPKDLLRALNEAKNANIDTLIIGRGGGASEDLSAFNDETLVREAAKFSVPIISAVGHEVDFTLIDYVADARASTPTGAAELATVDKRELYQSLDQYNDILDKTINKKLSLYKEKLKSILRLPFFINPKSMYLDKIEYLKQISLRLDKSINSNIKLLKESLMLKKSHFKALSVDNVLKRGYSIMQNNSGKIIKSTKDVKNNEIIITMLSDGKIKSIVTGKETKNGRKEN